MEDESAPQVRYPSAFCPQCRRVQPVDWVNHDEVADIRCRACQRVVATLFVDDESADGDGISSR
jgi:hypothetical protein